jgi:hypothetical protein
MSVAPAGPISMLKDALRTAIASSAWFQGWTGTASAAAAKAHILIGPVTEEDEPNRPFVWIDEPEQPLEAPLIGVNAFGLRVTLLIALQADVSAAHRNEGRDAKVEADNAVGQFEQMLRDQSGADLGDGTRLYLNERRVVSTARFHPLSEGADNRNAYQSWDALLEVTIGYG